MLRLLRDAGNLSDGGLYLVQRCHEVSSCGKALQSIRENDGSADAAAVRVDRPLLVVREVAAVPMAFVVVSLLVRAAAVRTSMLRFFISVVFYSLPGTFHPNPIEMNVQMQFESSVDYLPMQKSVVTR